MKLADIIEEWISGDWGNEQSSTEAQEKVYCLRSADISPIYHSTFDTAAIRYISAHSLSQNQLKEGDIVIEKSGGTNNCSTGRVILITKDILAKNKPLVCSNFCAAFRVKEKWDSAFVYYYFRLIHRSGVFLNFEGKTSGIHNLLIDTAFATIDFPDIDLQTQKRIASVLSNIDRKIALNRAMNEELEQTARDLYDYWFLQFDFPDANGKPYRSSGGKMVYNPQLKREIPEGWEVKCVADVLDTKTGKEDANFGTPNGKYKFFTCAVEPLLCDTPAFTGEAILIAGNGNFNVKHYNGKFNAYQRTYVLFPPEKYYGALYFAALERILPFTKASSGSIVKFITKGDIDNITFFEQPDDSIYRQLNLHLALIEKNQEEIDHLTSLRDKLLPLLMNGQVEVKE